LEQRGMTGLIAATIEAARAADADRVDAQVILPCTPVSVGTLRDLIRLLGGDFPRLHDVLLIVSELVTCGIQSRDSAGDVIATVAIGGHAARVAVVFDAAPVPEGTVNGEFGRRMTLVHGIADVCHHDTVTGRAETSAEVKW
jgi:hypothetical protein